MQKCPLPSGFEPPSESQADYMEAMTATQMIEYCRDQWNGGNEHYWPVIAHIIETLIGERDAARAKVVQLQSMLRSRGSGIDDD